MFWVVGQFINIQEISSLIVDNSLFTEYKYDLKNNQT